MDKAYAMRLNRNRFVYVETNGTVSIMPENLLQYPIYHLTDVFILWLDERGLFNDFLSSEKEYVKQNTDKSSIFQMESLQDTNGMHHVILARERTVLSRLIKTGKGNIDDLCEELYKNTEKYRSKKVTIPPFTRQILNYETCSFELSDCNKSSVTATLQFEKKIRAKKAISCFTNIKECVLEKVMEEAKESPRLQDLNISPETLQYRTCTYFEYENALILEFLICL